MAGLKFSSFGAATMPLSKIVVDGDLHLAPYGATVNDINAVDINAVNILSTDISARKITLKTVATASDNTKFSSTETITVTGTTFTAFKTINIPDGFLQPSSIRLKYTMTSDYGSPYHTRIVIGEWISDDYLLSGSTSMDISLDLTIGSDPIIIEGRVETAGNRGYIKDIQICYDEKPAAISPSPTWVI